MAKKAAKPKKRVIRARSSKKTLWERLFTIPRLTVYLFVVLTVVLFYQLSLPSKNVQGASTTASSNAKYYIQIFLFADKNSNGKWDRNTEDCLDNKAFKVTLINKDYPKGKVYPYVMGVADSCIYPMRSNQKENTLKFNFSGLGNWTPTGYTYSDGKVTKKTVKNTTTVKLVGGYGPSEGFDTGTLYDEVDFGLKYK